MDTDRSERGRLPRAEDLDDPQQLRRVLLDRDRRIVRLRTELVGMERWIAQLQAQADELRETADNAHAQITHLITTVPDLLEPEVDDLAERVEADFVMQQRVSLITLGVADLERACAFYAALGWAPGNDVAAQGVAFYQCPGMIIALWNRDELATDSGTEAHPPGAVTLAHNVDSPEAVDAVLAEAAAAGATVVRPGAATFWGGYSGCFHDLDGHPWEVAHNPFWTIHPDGSVTM